MKMLMNLIFVLMMFLGQSVLAEEYPYVPFEANPLSIKLSNDGTGIVQNIYCWKCDYKIVNITLNTKAYENGVQVPIQQARKRKGKSALVAFNPDTREVQTIRWSESR
jgi:hypothetical protein